jgi:hypothetical protein
MKVAGSGEKPPIFSFETKNILLKCAIVAILTVGAFLGAYFGNLNTMWRVVIPCATFVVGVICVCVSSISLQPVKIATPSVRATTEPQPKPSANWQFGENLYAGTDETGMDVVIEFKTHLKEIARENPLNHQLWALGKNRYVYEIETPSDVYLRNLATHMVACVNDAVQNGRKVLFKKNVVNTRDDEINVGLLVAHYRGFRGKDQAEVFAEANRNLDIVSCDKWCFSNSSKKYPTHWFFYRSYHG